MADGGLDLRCDDISVQFSSQAEWIAALTKLRERGQHAIKQLSKMVLGPIVVTIPTRLAWRNFVAELLDTYAVVSRSGFMEGYTHGERDLSHTLLLSLRADSQEFWNQKLVSVKTLSDAFAFVEQTKRYVGIMGSVFQPIEAYECLPDFHEFNFKVKLREIFMMSASGCSWWNNQINVLSKVTVDALIEVRNQRSPPSELTLANPLVARIASSLDTWRQFRKHETSTTESARLEMYVFVPYLTALKESVHAYASKLAVPEMLCAVEIEVDREQKICDAVFQMLDKGMAARARRCVQEAIISLNAEVICKDKTHGVIAALEFPVPDAGVRFRRLVSALDFDDHCRQVMKSTLENVVFQCTDRAVTTGQRNPAQYVDEVCRIRRIYHDVVAASNVTVNPLSFLHCIALSAHRALPNDGTVELALVKRVDVLFREKPSTDAATSSSATTTTAELRKKRVEGYLQDGCSLVRNVAAFLEAYKCAFLTRWFARHSRHASAESAAVVVLRSYLGADVVGHVLSLVADVSAQHGKCSSVDPNGGPSTAVSRTFLNLLALPAVSRFRSDCMAATIPPFAKAIVEEQVTAMNQSQSNRFQFTADPALSSTELHLHFGSSPSAARADAATSVSVRCSFVQAACIAALAQAPAGDPFVTQAVLANKCGLPEVHIPIVMATLEEAGLAKKTVNPGKGEASQSIRFALQHPAMAAASSGGAGDAQGPRTIKMALAPLPWN